MLCLLVATTSFVPHYASRAAVMSRVGTISAVTKKDIVTSELTEAVLECLVDAENEAEQGACLGVAAPAAAEKVALIESVDECIAANDDMLGLDDITRVGCTSAGRREQWISPTPAASVRVVARRPARRGVAPSSLGETGDVLGIVYARSRERGVGFAVSTTEIRPVLDSITDSRADTGRCI